MAKVRNTLSQWIQEFMETTKNSWDFLMLFDFDLGQYGPSALQIDMVLAALGRNETRLNQWDMLCANSLRHHFNRRGNPVGVHDCFAFRTAGHDAFNIPRCAFTVGKTLFQTYELYPVHSCFGGFAIYRVDEVFQCHYDVNLR